MNIFSIDREGSESTTAMMSQEQLERECVEAFKRGNKQDAERLLPQIGQPASIRTTTNYVPSNRWYARLVSLLHLAAHHGWMDIIIDLITKYKCDINCKDSRGRTPLHYAAINNHLEVVRYFINEQHCDPMTRDNDGNTPLHIAAQHGRMDIFIDLITKYKCDTNCKGSYGRTPLHYAVINNHLEVVRYFINELHYDPMTRDNDGDTLLHYACDYGTVRIVKYLLSTGKVDPLAKNKDGKTPMLGIYKITLDGTSRLSMLHLAAYHGWMDIIIDLITKYNCDTNCKDSRGCTPLHYAASNNHLEVVRYFINEQHCDPMTRDKNGDTPLHIACNQSHTHIVQYLLSTGKVNTLAKNKFGETPIDYVNIQDNSYDLLKLFQPFLQCKKDFPVHTYTKLVLTGYSGAGKTTISQLILLLASKSGTGLFSWLSSGRVTNVECLTAGIIPLHVESKVNEVGNMIIYDFAGQQEYYSSHAAVLERIMRNSAAIFVCIVDLSQCVHFTSRSVSIAQYECDFGYKQCEVVYHHFCLESLGHSVVH